MWDRRWDLDDPFRGHPSTRGAGDLRIAWRQQGDLLQLADMTADLHVLRVDGGLGVAGRSLRCAPPRSCPRCAGVSR